MTRTNYLALITRFDAYFEAGLYRRAIEASRITDCSQYMTLNDLIGIGEAKTKWFNIEAWSARRTAKLDERGAQT